MNTTRDVWLTPDAFDRLQEELAVLLAKDDSPVPEGTDHVSEARRRKARVREIQELIHHAVVGHVPPDDGIAEPGMVLTVRFDDDADTETFLLGVRDGADPGGLEVYSPESPLGTALSGARQGEQRRYTVPDGRTMHVTLVRAVPYGRHHESHE
ncbi:GreA/GreB family elongation factor [Amycolatopsis marina]|uniref:GreA/GreB family elongation factor n=1 Tax=Amycolatopsis marina TaxID=490629 RepID=A0A1I1BMW6_9PSEU|nr:GreA/GreB family elongation factor [Amycolatopsis marina]SFB49723.1 GreA/GreB family elongation factor [Amycolatopsis marina]